MSRTLWARLAVSALLVPFTACTQRASAPVPDPRSVLTLPSKDDVALIDGRALTLTAFSSLKAEIPKASTESLLWLGLGSMALQNHARAQGRELPALLALNIARYAAGELTGEAAHGALEALYGRTLTPPTPQAVRQQIDQLLRNATIVRNPQAIEEFRDKGES